jgi:hypothetical protein
VHFPYTEPIAEKQALLRRVLTFSGRVGEVYLSGVERPAVEDALLHLSSFPMSRLRELKAYYHVGLSKNLTETAVVPDILLKSIRIVLTTLELRGFRLKLLPFPAIRHLRRLVLQSVFFFAKDADVPAARAVVTNPNQERVYVCPLQLCAWLGCMPMLESVVLHGVQDVRCRDEDLELAALPMISLPHLAELSIIADLNLINTMLHALPFPRRSLTCCFESDAGVLSHQVEQLVKHACEFYYIGSDCLGEHLSELDVAPNGSSLSLKVSRFTKTLSLACNGRDAWTHSTEFCNGLPHANCAVPQLTVVSRCALPKLAAISPVCHVLDSVTELVVNISDLSMEDQATWLDGLDIVLLALITLRIVGTEASFFEDERLAWWLERRGRMGAARISRLILQRCCCRTSAPRSQMATIKIFVEEIAWV